MKTRFIKEFRFNQAEYYLSDTNGNKITLKIDYHNNKYQILSQKTNVDSLVEHEIKSLAKDLLKRKHRKNFAE